MTIYDKDLKIVQTSKGDSVEVSITHVPSQTQLSGTTKASNDVKELISALVDVLQIRLNERPGLKKVDGWSL